MTVLQKIKHSFVKGKPTFSKSSREQQKGNFFVVTFQKKTDIYYHSYQFEHAYLDKKITILKAKLGYLAFKLDRFQKQLVSLENDTKSVVFGGKKLFNNHYTLNGYIQNRDKWKKDFHHKRYNRMTISGRKDAKDGNFFFITIPKITRFLFKQLMVFVWMFLN